MIYGLLVFGCFAGCAMYFGARLMIVGLGFLFVGYSSIVYSLSFSEPLSVPDEDEADDEFVEDADDLSLISSFFFFLTLRIFIYWKKMLKKKFK